MKARLCAYCGASERLTREHLWPAALHRRIVAASDEKQKRFWLAKLEKEIPAEPTVRDVCSECNNGELSRLDGYICELFDRSFAYTPERYEKVEFVYDYHRLKRWLLKMCFNSARIHQAVDLKVFPPLLPYIMGKSDALGRSVTLYVQLAYPSELPAAASDDHQPTIYYPVINRVGHAWFDAEDVGRKLLRAVHIQSYSFYLAFFKPDEKAAVLKDFSAEFLARMPATMMLRPSRSKFELVCNGVDAWNSVSDARNIKLVQNDE